MLIIGDVHGKVEEYKQLLNGHCESIQIGDFGFKKEHDWFLNNIDQYQNRHRILFGNHDYLPYVEYEYSMKHFTYSSSIMRKSIFTIRGANSVDRAHRVEGGDWFRDEQITYNEMKQCIELYEQLKPQIVLSHECPKQICDTLFGIENNSLTSNGLQSMLEIHQPELWIFGHHHKHKDEIINGTRFICLAELETFII